MAHAAGKAKETHMISATDRSTRRQHEVELHEIRVQGHLDDRWADGVEGLTFTHERDGTTTLTGPLADQAALHGVLNRIRDLNVPIVSVRRLPLDRKRGTTMQAIVQDRYGSADVLQLREIDKPVVGDDDVLRDLRYWTCYSTVLLVYLRTLRLGRVFTTWHTPNFQGPPWKVGVWCFQKVARAWRKR